MGEYACACACAACAADAVHSRAHAGIPADARRGDSRLGCWFLRRADAERIPPASLRRTCGAAPAPGAAPPLYQGVSQCGCRLSRAVLRGLEDVAGGRRRLSEGKAPAGSGSPHLWRGVALSVPLCGTDAGRPRPIGAVAHGDAVEPRADAAAAGSCRGAPRPSPPLSRTRGARGRAARRA